MASVSVFGSRLLGGPFGLLRALSRPSLIALIVAAAAIASGMVTYANLTGLVPYEPTPAVLIVLFLIDLTLVLSLAALIAWRVTRIWTERRSGAAGARLHLRLVAMFSAIAAVPAIFVAFFAAASLNLGVEAWFSDRVRIALENSVSVANAYVEEHKHVIRGDALAMALDLNRAGPLLQGDQTRIVDLLQTEAQIRALPAVYLIDSKAQVLASARLPEMPDWIVHGPNNADFLRPPPTPAQFAQAKSGQVQVVTDPSGNIVTALVRLDAFVDAYLLAARAVDPRVVDHQQRTVEAVTEYQRLSQRSSEVQLTFVGLYVVVAMLILLAAVWLALWAANRIVSPIGRLAGAAERVSEGDLRVRVQVSKDDDEISSLGHAFNRMTSQLEAQRNQLVDANTQIDSRRRFTEAMLAGVSAGVLGLDGEGHVTLINRTASKLLKTLPSEAEGRHYAQLVPELAGLIRRAIAEAPGRASGQVDLRRDGALRHLNVQVSREAGESSHGLVVTFDDITDLVSAQRTAAWAEVARRIAHEIKNPLTPIQLSAERLKRKYAREVTTDPEVFSQCTDTIIRQVGDIGRMVDEFSSFARMPAPVIRSEQAQELVRHAVFLQRVAHPQIAFEITAPGEPLLFECDGRLVSQALTNVLKNAAEAIATRRSKEEGFAGRIAISIAAENGKLNIVVRDNGIGLPAEHRHRLTEPYVTTRAKGTGLGLAIVRKIMEDHGGELFLEDAPETEADERPGAQVRMVFPLTQLSKKEPGNTHEYQERVADRA
jgi:two-component system, NtrC family, nitrogen regulation sensor histidine kinase NtrY